MRFLRLFHAAERAARGEPRVVGAQATALEVVFEQREVRRQHAREVRFRAPWTERVEQATEESRERRHLTTRSAAVCRRGLRAAASAQSGVQGRAGRAS